MNAAELSEYCRQRGLFAEQITAWRLACEQANDRDRASSVRLSQATKDEKKRITALEATCSGEGSGGGRSFARSQKKSRGDLGGRRGRMISVPDRQRAVELIDEATAAGARRFQACAELRISERTARRWMVEGVVRVDQRPGALRPTPRNKLSDQERQAVLDVCHSGEFASLSPSQIVPRLADQAATSPRSPASTAFCARRVSSIIVAAPSRRCPVSRPRAIAPLGPVRSGPGTSPGCPGQSPACSSISTSSWTSSAARSLAGRSMAAKARSTRPSSCAAPSGPKAASRARSCSMPTTAAR